MPPLLQHRLRSYFFAGLLVWLPIMATLFVIRFVVGVMDSTLSLLPMSYQPQHLFGTSIPGLGVILSVLVVFSTGVLVTNYLGGKFIALGESLVARIPLVRTIYKAVKQIAETLFSSGSQSFRHAYLVQYPRAGMWSVAFQTGVAGEELVAKTGSEMITLFIPTTPNPTSGFLLLVPKQDAIKLDMSADEAFKLVISLGVVQP